MFDLTESQKDGQPHEHSYRDAFHRHAHGVTDPALFSTQRGIWAITWSCVGLLATALFQVVIVFLSGSVALLADTIHNFGDAATALPLWIAFRLARWKPNRRFTYGYGRVEDLAGVAIVLTILFSAIVAGYESIERLFHPQAVEYLWAVDAELSVQEGHEIAKEARHQLLHHVSYLSDAIIHVDPVNAPGEKHHRIAEHEHDSLPAHSH